MWTSGFTQQPVEKVGNIYPVFQTSVQQELMRSHTVNQIALFPCELLVSYLTLAPVSYSPHHDIIPCSLVIFFSYSHTSVFLPDTHSLAAQIVNTAVVHNRIGNVSEMKWDNKLSRNCQGKRGRWICRYGRCSSGTLIKAIFFF